MRLSRSIALLLPALLGLSACGADEETPFRVMGSVEVTVSDGVNEPGQVGFNFPTDTMLADDRASQEDGAIAGHCELTGTGDSWALEIAIARTGSADDGLRSFTLSVSDATVGRRQASLVMDLGGATFKSDESCFAELGALSPAQGAVTISLECAGITSPDSETLRLSSTTNLEISGCHARPGR